MQWSAVLLQSVSLFHWGFFFFFFLVLERPADSRLGVTQLRGFLPMTHNDSKGQDTIAALLSGESAALAQPIVPARESVTYQMKGVEAQLAAGEIDEEAALELELVR